MLRRLGHKWRTVWLHPGLAETAKGPGSPLLAGKSWTWHSSRPAHGSLEGRSMVDYTAKRTARGLGLDADLVSQATTR